MPGICHYTRLVNSRSQARVGENALTGRATRYVLKRANAPKGTDAKPRTLQGGEEAGLPGLRQLGFSCGGITEREEVETVAGHDLSDGR